MVFRTKQRVELIRVKKANLPNFKKLSPKFWTTVAKSVEGSIIQNINEQQQADGSPLKRNSPTTLKIKREADPPRDQKSLIDHFSRFVQTGGGSWTILRKKRKFITVGAATGELRKLNKSVQRLGFVGWLGINKKGRASIRAKLRREIKRQFKEALAKTKKEPAK